MKLFATLVLRDVARAGGGVSQAVAFFVLTATLYPFAVGPDSALLARTGGGMLWVAALLAALLPIDRLIAPDATNGVIDQLVVRGVSEEIVVLAKLIAHWLSFAPALMLAAVVAAGLLHLDGGTLLRLELGLLLGTPALAALGMMTAALTTGLRNTAALGALMMLPLAVPVLIFGAGSLSPTSGGALKLLAAASLLLVAIAPFSGGAALRAARE